MENRKILLGNLNGNFWTKLANPMESYLQNFLRGRFTPEFLANALPNEVLQNSSVNRPHVCLL